MLWIANMLLGAAGGALFAIGWRGRLLDDHRYCRRCRYDLVGSSADETRCPECGADLAGHRAVRQGRRGRRRWALGLGCGLLVLAAAGTVLFAVQTDWTPYKPVWLLEMDLRSVNATVAQRARQEIIRRINAGAMRDGAVDRLVDEALLIQSDPAAPWDTFWGDVIETARPMGHVTEAQMQQFLRTAFHEATSLSIRPSARAGSRVLLLLERRRARVGSQGSYQARIEYRWIRIGEHVVGKKGQRRGDLRLSASSSGRGGSGIPIEVSPGTYTVSAEAECSMWPASVDPEDGEPLLRWTTTFTAPLRVEPEAVDVVALRPDPALEDTLCELIEVRQCALVAFGRSLRAQVRLKLPQPPVSVAFDVLWRVGQREWLVDYLVVPAGSRGIALATPPIPHQWGQLDGFPSWVGSVDLVLRTNPRVAEATVEITEVWDGEIVLEDVPLDRTPP